MPCFNQFYTFMWLNLSYLHTVLLILSAKECVSSWLTNALVAVSINSPFEFLCVVNTSIKGHVKKMLSSELIVTMAKRVRELYASQIKREQRFCSSILDSSKVSFALSAG